MEHITKTNDKRCYVDEERSSKKIKIGKSIQEESNFDKLFTAILDFFIERETIKDESITNSIASIITSFHFSKGHSFSDIDYEKTENLCGYIFRYGAHGAGLVRKRVLNAICNCEVLKARLKESELNIISLGGGPGNDIVGLCSALYESKCRSILNLTVADRFRRWAPCVNLVEFFIREGSYGNISKLFQKSVVNFSYIQVSLPGEQASDVKYLRSLKEANIIIISKLMSILRFEKQEEIIKSLSNMVNPTALLLYIDSPFHDNLWTDFDILYHLRPEEPYVKQVKKLRFGHDDNIQSKSEIVVLRKKTPK